MPNQSGEVKRLFQDAIRPEPVEQAAEACLAPSEALIRRFEDEVIPLVEQERDPAQRLAMLARVEEELRGVFKDLDDLANDLRETRRRCTELFRAARKLRPRAKARRSARRRPARRRPPRPEPTDEQKEAVLDALRRRGAAVAMSELCYETGFGAARLKRIVKALGNEGRAERFGTASATRYRCTEEGARK